MSVDVYTVNDKLMIVYKVNMTRTSRYIAHNLNPVFHSTIKQEALKPNVMYIMFLEVICERVDRNGLVDSIQSYLNKKNGDCFAFTSMVAVMLATETCSLEKRIDLMQSEYLHIFYIITFHHEKVKLKRFNAYWEKNEWSRKHGYSRPLDTYFILQWVSSLTLDIGFFGFLTHFVSDYTTSVSESASLQADWTEFRNTAQVPWWISWNAVIMFGLSGLVKTLSVTTSLIDTEDLAVKQQQVPRSQTYIKRFGIPVIDSYTGICNICRVKVGGALEPRRHGIVNCATSVLILWIITASG
ncbi:hypothetical protein BCV71DRAFT_238882 [Rhizopus microsporus]|uniref:Uncharacterized protein n=1 Tax=Rhizopus microsporus TaxID=58291 RepID=A0A1X0RPG2_RHIZD|nr:hypothetical protein BCV71DRAFT_238882 [Rhizopus microsporus]